MRDSVAGRCIASHPCEVNALVFLHPLERKRVLKIVGASELFPNLDPARVATKMVTLAEILAGHRRGRPH